MPAPLAYFLTWTCHGTWLHGDARGSVDRHHNTPDSPYLESDPDRTSTDVCRMASAPVTLDASARDLVDATIREHCAIRAWELLAINVRSSHVHAVVRCPPSVSPEAAMNQLKAWSTRRLRERGMIAPDRRVWTEHGSTRWINDPAGLAGAIGYVLHQQ